MSRILALDLGSKTGWALWDGEVISSGTWVLASDKALKAMRKEDGDRRRDIRALALRDRIAEARPDVILFEDVKFSSYTMQTQLWASLRGVVWLACSEIYAVPVQTLKVFATGKGNATKGMMAWAMPKSLFTLEQFSHDKPTLRENGTGRLVDDNEVDAYHLLQYGSRELKLWTPIQIPALG